MSEEDTIGPKKPVPKKPAASKIKSKPAATKVEPIEDAPDTEMADDVKPAAEEDDDDDDNDEEDEDAEDEYVVEKIISHAFNDQNVCLYEVKWLGYESATDRTWEPEENL
jgi:chromobox protein 1